MNSLAGQGLFIGVGVLFALLGAGVMITAWRTRQRLQASAGWPTTEGEVVETQIRREESATGEDDDTMVRFYPEIRYTYRVLGQTYTGTRLSFGGPAGYLNRAEAAAVLNRYPVGGRVMVYYNPANPQEAVLERRAEGVGCNFVVGAAFFLLGLVLLLVGLLALRS